MLPRRDRWDYRYRRGRLSEGSLNLLPPRAIPPATLAVWKGFHVANLGRSGRTRTCSIAIDVIARVFQGIQQSRAAMTDSRIQAFQLRADKVLCISDGWPDRYPSRVCRCYCPAACN